MGWVGVEVEWVSQNMDSWQQREEQRGKAKESSGGHRRSVTVESIGDTGMVGWGAERKRAGVEGGGRRRGSEDRQKWWLWWKTCLNPIECGVIRSVTNNLCKFKHSY